MDLLTLHSASSQSLLDVWMDFAGNIYVCLKHSIQALLATDTSLIPLSPPYQTSFSFSSQTFGPNVTPIISLPLLRPSHSQTSFPAYPVNQQVGSPQVPSEHPKYGFCVVPHWTLVGVNEEPQILCLSGILIRPSEHTGSSVQFTYYICRFACMNNLLPLKTKWLG